MLNLSFMGLLPRIFFRGDGKFNLMWWLTSAPFFLSALLASLYYFKFLVLMPEVAVFQVVLEGVSAALSVVSISLMCYTLGTHRRPLALWHQNNDAPVEIVTYGAYKYIRHPFYSSFILAALATLVLCPSIWSALLVLYGLLILNYTAAREERNLSASAFGEKYRAYMTQSGRFIPKF
jgi:protein-S-isoprenylcysteine O-methyltransferase Ste14